MSDEGDGGVAMEPPDPDRPAGADGAPLTSVQERRRRNIQRRNLGYYPAGVRPCPVCFTPIYVGSVFTHDGSAGSCAWCDPNEHVKGPWAQERRAKRAELSAMGMPPGIIKAMMKGGVIIADKNKGVRDGA